MYEPEDFYPHERGDADEPQAIAPELATANNLNAVLVPVLVLDASGVVRFANRAAERLFGRSRDALTGTCLGLPVLHEGRAEIDILQGDGTARAAALRLLQGDWEGVPSLFLVLQALSERTALHWPEAA